MTDFNEQLSAIQGIYSTDCVVETDKYQIKTYTVNLSKNPLLLQEKIEGKLFFKLDSGKCHTTFEGTGFSRLIFLEIGEMIHKSNQNPETDLYKLILEVTELLVRLALESQKERNEAIQKFKSQIIVEEVKPELNYSLNIQKYVTQKGASTQALKVDFDNFVKKDSSIIWKTAMEFSETEYAAGTNGTYIIIVTESGINVYDIVNDVWKEVVPLNKEVLDPLKCSVYFGGKTTNYSTKLTMEVFDEDRFLTLADTEESYGKVDPGQDPKKLTGFRKSDDFFKSKFSKWESQRHHLFRYDRNSHVSLPKDGGYFVYSGVQPDKCFTVRTNQIKIIIDKKELTGHKIGKRAGFSHFFQYPNLFIYGGKTESDSVSNELFSINMFENTVTKITTFGPSPPLAYPFPLYPKGEDEYLLFGGYETKDHLNTNMYILNSKTYEMSIFNPGEKTPLHFKGTPIQAQGKLYLFGGQKSIDYINHNKNVDTLEFEYSIEINTPPIYGDYSKWFRLQNEKESDVVFYFGLEQKRVYAHKFIIQITCPKLYHYILEAEKRQKDPNEQTQVYEIFDKKVYFNVFGTFVEFLYSFSLHLDPKVWNKERFEMLLYLSQKFECKILEETILGQLRYETIVSSHLNLQIEKYAVQFITGKLFGEKTPQPGNGIVYFMFDDGPLYAHKTLLTKRSSYFHSMFESVGFQESETGVVEMPEYISKASLLAILEYIYVGKKPHVSVKDAVGLYYAVAIYDLKELKPYLRSIISQNVTLDNVYDILHFADMLVDEFLCQLCATCLSRNYEDVKDTEEYQNVPTNVKLMVSEKNMKDTKKLTKKHK